MGERGESAYDEVDGVTVVDIPAQAVKGRVEPFGKTFSGYLDLEKGLMRLDCAESPEFYVIINLNQCPAFAAAPGGREAEAAQRRFSKNATGD